MSEPQEWVSLEDVPSIADYRALNEADAARENGAGPVEREDSWQPIDLSQIPDEPPQPPNLGGLGIVYPGKRHVFSGPQESAKTLAAYVIGLEVIRTEQKRVVLIDFEMGQWDARRRLIELGATMDELAQIAYLEPAERAEGTVIEQLVQLQPGLVIIDAAAGAFDLQSLDDNKRQDVERLASVFVEPFRRARIATILLDHVVKNAEARGKYAIGSERKVGGADVHLGFEVVHPIKRGSHGLYKIVTHKDRGGFLKRGKLAEFVLESDPETNVIAWSFRAPVEADEDAPFRPTGIMEKVSRYLEIQSQPIATNAIKTAGLGKHEYVDMALAALVTEAFVEESAGPRGARMFESLEPYRETADTSPRPRPDLAPEPGITTSPPRPSPYGGAKAGEFAPEGGVTSPQGTLDDDDGIPF